MKVKRKEALKIILDSVSPVSWEYVTLTEAYGRVLAEEVFSPESLPSVDKSAVDGYALNLSAVETFPASFNIVGEVKAGELPSFELKEGEAAFVMTGGVVPSGADAVVRIEDVKVSENRVKVSFPVKKGELINYVGSEVKKGETVLKRGEFLDYRKVALLSHLGIYKIKVFQRIKVGLLTTGNELLEPYEPFSKVSVRNTNFYLINGLLKRLGVDVINFGNVKDDLRETVEAFEVAFESVDFLVTTGGVSKGKYDLVKKALETLGFKIEFTSTNIRPGRPLVFAVKGEKRFFGLPGYPSAALVNALEFLTPAFKKVMGFREFENRYLTLPAGKPLRSKIGRVDFVRAYLKMGDRGTEVYDYGNQQTSNFLTASLCEGFAVIDEDRGTVERGEFVEFLPVW